MQCFHTLPPPPSLSTFLLYSLISHPLGWLFFGRQMKSYQTGFGTVCNTNNKIQAELQEAKLFKGLPHRPVTDSGRKVNAARIARQVMLQERADTSF